MTTTPTPLTADEIQECIDSLETNYHPNDDFESECPGCTAKEKLKAMLAAAPLPPEPEGAKP